MQYFDMCHYFLELTCCNRINSACEGDFSHMTVIKTTTRERIPRIVLPRIWLHGPPLGSFLYGTVVTQ